MHRVGLHLSVSVAAAAMLFGTPLAAAQVKFSTAKEYIDQHRPKIEKRALTAKEKETARDVIAALKKNGKLTEAQLNALRPIANAGDIPAMYAMFEGYSYVRDMQTRIMGGSDREFEAWQGLRGLWAKALWQEDEFWSERHAAFR